MLKRYVRRFIPRSWSNDELRKIAEYLPKHAAVINVSGWEDKDKEGMRYKDYFYSPSIYHVSNYSSDKFRGGNVYADLSINLDESLNDQYVGQYNIVLNHTVLEHVMDPVFSFQQISKLTTDIIITIVPFKQKLHFESGAYGDYYRFTPFSMRMLHEKHGFKILYESFTPPPALDVYLIYIGTKQPEKYNDFPQHVVHIDKLNEVVGSYRAMDLAQNIVMRFLTKYMIISKNNK